jgi:hypothetical protein
MWFPTNYVDDATAAIVIVIMCNMYFDRLTSAARNDNNAYVFALCRAAIEMIEF